LARALLAAVMLLVAPGRLHAALFDSLPVYRVQLGTTTCDRRAAGTDDAVKVKLNSANSTWLDYSHNDFEPGASFTYDLGLESIATLGDISMLRISKGGSDRWCIRRLTLYVNNAPIFERDYSPSGRWLGNRRRGRRALTISGEHLRSDLDWTMYIAQLPPSRIRRRELESRIESAVGDGLHGQRLTWGHLHGRAVELRRRSGLVYSGDLDLKLKLSGWPDPAVDVDFQLAVSCDAGQLAVTVHRLKFDVDSPWYSDVATLGTVDQKIRDTLKRAFRRFSLTRSTAVLICPPALGIMSNGDLRLY
jgi:PLAT/LH2 domain